MDASCLFGIFVFGSKVELNYRFLSLDLFTYFFNRFSEQQQQQQLSRDSEVRRIFLKGFATLFSSKETDDVLFTIDDAITLYLSTLLHLYDQTRSRNNPIKRITLESNIQVFFDQVNSNEISSRVSFFDRKNI